MQKFYANWTFRLWKKVDIKGQIRHRTASLFHGSTLLETFPTDSRDKAENRVLADADGNNLISSFTLIRS